MISVVIPALDRAHMLPATLAPWRIRGDCQLIVVDDGSTDESASVAAAHGAEVVRLPESLGPAAARNAGLDRARGDHVVFLDADIVVPERFAEEVARAHAYATDLVVLGLRRQQPPPDRPDTSPRRDSRQLLADLYSYNLARHPQPWALAFSCVLSAPRALLDRAALPPPGGVFDPDFRRWGLDDLELGLRLAAAGARWAFALGVDSDHQYHDREMTAERFAGWCTNLSRMVRRHPAAGRYTEMSRLFDPAVRADFLDTFQSFAGPPPSATDALVLRVRADAPLPALLDRVARTDEDSTVFLVAQQPSSRLAAACATVPQSARIALYPEEAWDQVAPVALAGCRKVITEEFRSR
jgi:GT2 family glycosyltransferase